MKVEKGRVERVLKFIIVLILGLFAYLLIFDSLLSDSILSMLFWSLLVVAVILMLVSWVIKKQ